MKAFFKEEAHMKRVVIFALLLGLWAASPAFGQNFRGTYVLTSGGVTLTLVFDQDSAGRVSGTLSSTTGTRFRLEGTVEEGVASGTCAGDSAQSFFEAEFEGSKLILTLTEVNGSGAGTSRSLEFARSASSTQPAPPTPSALPWGAAPKASPPAAPTDKFAPASPAQSEGQRVSDPDLGISFVAPADWIAHQQSGFILLGSNTLKGFILIQAHSYSSISQMAEEAEQGIVDEEEGIQLSPASAFQAFGSNGLSGEFSGVVQGRQAKAYAIGLISPRGGGVTIMAAVESGSYSSAYPGFVRAIASSLTFTPLQPSSSVGTAMQSDAALMKYFAGEYYSYSSGATISGGAGTERSVTLCPDGLYRDSYEFSASGSGWGGAASRAGAAQWSIRGDQTQGLIVVSYANGQRKQFSYQVVSKSEGTILFDGVKFAFAGAPKCR
jgi:hypothetical protein